MLHSFACAVLQRLKVLACLCFAARMCSEVAAASDRNRCLFGCCQYTVAAWCVHLNECQCIPTAACMPCVYNSTCTHHLTIGVYFASSKHLLTSHFIFVAICCGISCCGHMTQGFGPYWHETYLMHISPGRNHDPQEPWSPELPDWAHESS